MTPPLLARSRAEKPPVVMRRPARKASGTRVSRPPVRGESMGAPSSVQRFSRLLAPPMNTPPSSRPTPSAKAAWLSCSPSATGSRSSASADSHVVVVSGERAARSSGSSAHSSGG